ncbi:MAG: thioesterase family protein [Planctomycetaceae bacterium]
MGSPRIGTAHETSFKVEAQQTVVFSGLPPVLATPWLIWQLEMTALSLLEPFLEEGQFSVGSQVELEHLAPAPLGTLVTCRARVIHVDGPAVNFQIEASDATETLSRGVHRRHVIEIARLARRIERKAAGA